MRKNERHIGRTALIFLTLIILISTHAYFVLENPFEPKWLPSEISGQVVSENQEGKIDLSLKEKLVLGAEWVLVFFIFLKLLIQGKVEFQEYDLVITKDKIKPEISNTDLDTLYNLLKEKKKIPVKSLAVYFKVDEKTIIAWARILEEANLLTIHYPNFGHPILILNEEVKNESKEK